jgi:Ion channel
MVATLVGVLLILVTLADCFESLVLPRRITRRWRLTKFYFRVGWGVWTAACRLLPAGRYRQNTLSIYGPLSLFGLFACWVALLVTGFALVQWGAGSLPGEMGRDFRQCLYHSGETFFTLGYGDVTPSTYFGKAVAVIEAGTGFGFMAVIIGYLPVLYQAFSRRELNIALLDARAGSPPTAGELFRRFEGVRDCSEVERFLGEWEVWAAELLESHLSYPILSYYRSQHDNQNWLAALAVALDASAVLLVAGSDEARRRAQRTFAMARHACVDLCLVFWLPPREPERERLTDAEANTLLALAGSDSPQKDAEIARLRELRVLYEPFLAALSEQLLFQVPRYFPESPHPDNWQTTAWTERAPGITELPSGGLRVGEHFG